MKHKLELILLGYAALLGNLLLIDTRFNIVGLGFGIIAAVAFIKALLIKEKK